MSVIVVGIEHQQASLDVLEQVALGEADIGKVLATLRDGSNVQESVILSTCLRTEVYAVVDRFHEAVDEVHELLADLAGLPLSVVESHSAVRFDDDVAVHLFSVAAGLESAVLGEGEVLGQVRRAWERAREERASGPVLGELFRHALHTGKRVRSETGIARGTTSFSHAAVELADARRPGGLGGTSVVVMGAGEMGAGVVRALVSLPDGGRPGEVVVANRTLAKARRLTELSAPGVAVRAVGVGRVAPALAGADVVVSAVEASAHVLGPEELCGPEGRSRPVLVVDLGVPRNVDPSVADDERVTVLDMDDLRTAVARATDGRRSEATRASAIVHEDIERYRAAARARGAAPVIAALRTRMEDLRRAELDRHRPQLGALDPPAWEAVDAVTKAVLAKLVHDPTMLLRESAGTPRGERLVEALRTLFDL